MQTTAMKEHILQIDHDAPLTTRKEIFIAASPEAVWQLHTDINHWADWRSDISLAVLEGSLKPGAVFVWKTPGVAITSTLQEVETNRRIGWTGTGLGTKAAHIWTLEPRDNGTLVITEESMSGWLPRVMKLIMPGFLDKSLDIWLADLKKHLQCGRGIGVKQGSGAPLKILLITISALARKWMYSSQFYDLRR